MLDIIELYEVPGGNLVDGLPPAPSLELCAIFDNSFSEVRFFLHTVSYGAPAGKIFRALGAILISKDLQEPTLPAVQFGR
mgnify:CR=1 FL=1